jgi:hypothetical protein
MRTGVPPAGLARVLIALGALALLAGIGAALAQGERTQYGKLVVSLDGGLAPLKLPRDHKAPVAIRLGGGLRTTDGSTLPRVTRIALGLPGQGELDTRGLPVCAVRRLRNATVAEALQNCRPALVGHGKLAADVLIPTQAPFRVHASLLVFNGRVGGHDAVLLHAFSARPPSVAVVPFLVRRGSGRFPTSLVARLPPALGPWPRFAHFELELSRRFTYRGRARSYLNASCPIPIRFTAGFFSFARATFTLAGGREVSTGIARGCRAR